MALFSYDSLRRSALLLCDDCRHVLLADGGRSTSPHDTLAPDDLAPHFQFREELAAFARQAGWVSSGDDPWSWSCPACASTRATRP